jgi:small subunit ribosomal protein S13
MGVDIPGRKRVEYALRYIHGIGPKRATAVVEQCKVDPAKKADDLTQNIRRLISIGSYRGLRHKRGLPVRGQRTRTNARTRKGGKKTVGAVRDRGERAAMKAKT